MYFIRLHLKFRYLDAIGDCCTSKTCSPALLERIKVPKSARARSAVSQTKKAPKKGVPHLPTQEILTEWRLQAWVRNHSDSTWGPLGLLSEELIDFLSSIGSISDYDSLKRLFAHRWGWWESYGHEIAEVICPLVIPYTPIPPKRRERKRKAAEIDSGEAISNAASASRSTRPRPPTLAPAANSAASPVVPTSRRPLFYPVPPTQGRPGQKY
jgi:hypothetical protein